MKNFLPSVTRNRSLLYSTRLGFEHSNISTNSYFGNSIFSVHIFANIFDCFLFSKNGASEHRISVQDQTKNCPEKPLGANFRPLITFYQWS